MAKSKTNKEIINSYTNSNGVLFQAARRINDDGSIDLVIMENGRVKTEKTETGRFVQVKYASEHELNVAFIKIMKEEI